jgi:hypothetical protein
MKKYLNFSVLMVVLTALCVVVSSCSEDDVNDVLYSGGNATINLNGEKMEVYHVNAGLYTTFFEFKLYTEDEGLLSNNFYCYWTNVSDLNEMKVGDDITKYPDFEFFYHDGYNERYSYKSGKITVTKINTKNKEMSLDIDDISVTDGTLSGKVNLKYRIN